MRLSSTALAGRDAGRHAAWEGPAHLLQRRRLQGLLAPGQAPWPGHDHASQWHAVRGRVGGGYGARVCPVVIPGPLHSMHPESSELSTHLISCEMA